MSALPIEELGKTLWPHGETLQGPQVHMLVDGARDPAIVDIVRRGKLEYSCLFSGTLTPQLQAAAPYLVHLSDGSRTTLELLRKGWGNSWGMFIVAPADVTIVQQRRHFKKFLKVRTEDGRELAFRFYDPRVLRVYLPTCTAQEHAAFMGPVSKIFVENTDASALIEFSK